MPQNAEEFRKAAPGATFGKVDTYEVNRPMREVAAAFRRTGWQVLLILPLVLFPLGMLIDLYAWLWYAGHAIDPTSPMSMTVKPFTPALIGTQKVANFTVTSWLGPGTYLQLAASALLLAAAMVGRKLARIHGWR